VIVSKGNRTSRTCYNIIVKCTGNYLETVMHMKKSISFVDCKLSFVNTYFISIVYIVIKLRNNNN